MTKRIRILIYPLIVGALVVLAISCKKDENTEKSITVTDIDGNVYHTVAIGSQVWMVENLKVTHFRNGDAIPKITGTKEWHSADGTTDYSRTTGAYCNWNNNDANSDISGHLYNWYAATDSRNICPEGWHVPTEAEFRTLITYLGGEAVAGGKLKESGTSNWLTPNTGANNSSGFKAIPGGVRGWYGDFWDNEIEGTDIAIFWSSTSSSSSTGYMMFCLGNTAEVTLRSDADSEVPTLQNGYSIRCIKD